MQPQDLQAIETKTRQWAGQCGDEFVALLIDSFLTDAPERLAVLRQSYGARAQDEFKRAAHTLKSNSGQLGIDYYASVAQRVELAARDGRMAEVGDQVDWLESEFAEVRASLQTLRGAFAGAPKPNR